MLSGVLFFQIWNLDLLVQDVTMIFLLLGDMLLVYPVVTGKKCFSNSDTDFL